MELILGLGIILLIIVSGLFALIGHTSMAAYIILLAIVLCVWKIAYTLYDALKDD